MAELLLELLSEEIPARMQGRAAEDFKRLVLDGLKGAGLSFGHADAYATPRRLALVVEGIPERQPDQREERKGPRMDAPEKAIQGFLGSVGLASVAQCETRETEKGTFLFAVAEKKGVATEEVLPGILTEAIRRLPWPKSMRWADTGFRWVRPLHSILALFAGGPLTGVLDLHGATLHFGVTTRGHRFLAPDEVAVRSFADYRAKLKEAYVVLDSAERRASIERQLAGIAAAENLAVRPDPALLDEVAGLVEWPVVLAGAVDPDFMDVPADALTASMRTHQKYFALLNPDGTLAPRFALVANMEAPDGGKRIVAGNERVLRARLADAKFFWDQDRRTKLADRIPALDGVTFHAKLGTLGDKAKRIENLARVIAEEYVRDSDPSLAARAARLAKADLVSGMVGEFPELQGVMGRYYALNDDEHPNVALAIAEHYAPQGPNDRCPKAPDSVAVALADKIDTLVGFWAIDEKPTGSKDPYALRRAALGVIRLILENELRLPLRHMIVEADRARCEAENREYERIGEFIADDLLSFFADRLKVHLRERGIRHDLISAVFALGGEDDFERLLARADALEAFLRSDDGANLLIAYRRAANILRIEEKKDDRSYAGEADPALFRQDEEKALSEALKMASAAVRSAVAAEGFAAAMAALARLRAPVDAFFDEVTVNAEQSELRANRLKLLSGIRDTMGAVADFSQIEG